MERLGCRILSKKEINENKLFQYPYPVSESKQQKILQQLKNETLLLNEQELANIIGCGKRTISSIINGRSIFKNKAFKSRLDQLVKITNMLLGIIKKEELPQWIRCKLKDLNGRQPLTLLMNGEAEELYIWAYAELEGRYQ